MVADADSNIAWHRVQLRKNRTALRALETTRFTIGEIASSKRDGHTQKAIGELRRKIAQSERCIAEHDKLARRPLATDLNSLASASWDNWSAYTLDAKRSVPRSARRT